MQTLKNKDQKNKKEVDHRSYNFYYMAQVTHHQRNQAEWMQAGACKKENFS